MKPHHELFGVLIENDLWSFENTSSRNIRSLIFIINRQCNAFVGPIKQILRGIYMDTDLRPVADSAGNFVLPYQ